MSDYHGYNVRRSADLIRAVNLLPATCGQSRPDCSAEEAEDRRNDGLSVVASADDRLWRTIGINGCAGPEAGAGSNSCADECVAAPMPRALGIHLLDALTRYRLIRSSAVDHDGFVALKHQSPVVTEEPAHAVVVIPVGALTRANTQESMANVKRRELLGVLYLDSKRPAAFSKLDRQILDALAADAASILHNVRLAEHERERQRLEQQR